MTELEKIAYAKSFMDKLAQGINPIDDTQIPEGDVANNVRLSRCFFYVSEILRQVIDNGGTSPANKDPESTLVQLRKENTVEVPKERTVSIINGKIYTSDMNGYDDVCNQALNTTNTVEVSVHTHIEENKEIKSCSDCYHNRSGECSSWEVCDDFRPAINLSKTDTDYWPTEGDATFIKQKGHKRYD